MRKVRTIEPSWHLASRAPEPLKRSGAPLSANSAESRPQIQNCGAQLRFSETEPLHNRILAAREKV